MTAIKTGKVNGNTVRQQIAPLNKSLAQLVQQVEAKKNSKAAGNAATKAMAGKGAQAAGNPQAAPAEPKKPQIGFQPQKGEPSQEVPLAASYSPKTPAGFSCIFEKEIFRTDEKQES